MIKCVRILFQSLRLHRLHRNIAGRNSGAVSGDAWLQRLTRLEMTSKRIDLLEVSLMDHHEPRITHIAETVLYSDDLLAATQFYENVLAFPALLREDRFVSLKVADEEVLLIFKRGGSVTPTRVEGGTVVAHDGSGPLHVCFGIAAEDLAYWEARLASHSVPIESRVDWPFGTVSLYFRDPDGHAVELATPGLWKAPSGR